MRYLLAFLMLCPLAHGSCPTQAKDEAALEQAERTWARALEEQDVEALRCLLADEFEDVSPSAETADKHIVLGRVADHKSTHHELSELQGRVYGDFGYIRGVATAVSAQGGAGNEKVRFTDVYVYRDGRWQCVAAQESSFPHP